MARHRARLGRILFATGLLVPAVVLLGAPVYAEGEANSGSIKIAQVDDGTHPDNDPHQDSCVFRVDFYGFRAGTYHVAVALHPPTGSRVVLTDSVTIDEKAKTSGSSKSKSYSKSKSSSGSRLKNGSKGDDDERDDERRERTYKASSSSSVKGSTYQTSRTYDVTTHVQGSERHAKHGYHLRVDVKRDGYSGSGSKTKVFWLSCGPNGGVSGDDDDDGTDGGTVGGGGTTDGGTVGGGGTTDGGTTDGGTSGGGTTSGGTEVLGEQTTRAQTATVPTRAEVLGMQVFRPTPGEVPAGVGSRLASTGVSTYLLLALGAAMVLASLALARDNLIAARKRRT